MGNKFAVINVRTNNISDVKGALREYHKRGGTDACNPLLDMLPDNKMMSDLINMMQLSKKNIL